MKSALLILIGFIAGIAGVMAWRSSSPSGNTANAAPGGKSEIRRVEIPKDFVRDLEARLEKARRSPGERQSTTELQREIDRWMLADPMACMNWLHQRGALGLVRREQFSAVFASAFRGNLAAAIRESMNIPDARFRHDWLISVFKEAAQSSPEQALALIEFLPTDLRTSISRSVAVNLARKDPAAAWTAVLGSKSSWYRKGINRYQDHYTWASDVLQTWADTNPETFADFLRTKLAEAGSGREAVLFAQALQDVAMSPSAIRVLEILANRERNATLENNWTNALGHAANINADDALRFAQQLPQGLARDRALEIIALVIGPGDFDRAEKIVEGLSGDALKHSVLQSILERRAATNLRDATTRAERIENQLSRTETMKSVVASSLSREPKAFLAMVFESGASDTGSSWMDLVVDSIRNNQSLYWVQNLDGPTKDRLRDEVYGRFSPEDWARVEKSFLPEKK